MAYREYYVCAAEDSAGANNKIECVAIAEGECFFTDVERSLCKYIPGDAVKKVVFEQKYPGYTIGITTKSTIADLSMSQSISAVVSGMK